MKKILYLLLLVAGTAKAQITHIPGYAERNTKDHVIATAADGTLHGPAGSSPSLNGGWARAGALYIDSIGGDSKGLYGYWDGTWHHLLDSTRVAAMISSFDTVDSLFGQRDNLSTANRLHDQSTYKFQLGGQGQLVLGNDQFISMNARVRIQAPYSQNLMFLGDSTQNTANNIADVMIRRYDTINSTNVSTKKFALVSFERVWRPANNYFMPNYYAGFANSYFIEPQDSARITSQGGDFSAAFTNSIVVRKYPGFSGKSVLSAHTSDSPIEVIPSTVSIFQTYGSTSLANNFRVRGWYSPFVSHLIIPGYDSVMGQYAGFFSHAAVDGYVKKYYGFFDSGGGDAEIDSTFSFWAPYSKARSWIGGSLHVGDGITSVNSYMGGINPASVLFDVGSTTKGSRPAPTMTSAQMLAISSPATGLMVFCTDSTSYCYYTGSIWLKMTGSGGGGSATTIYTGDGTVSGNRTIAGATNTIAFNDFSQFAFNDGTRDRLQIRTTKTQLYDPAGVRTINLADSIYVDGLANVIDTVRHKVVTIDVITKSVSYSPWQYAGGSGGTPAGSTTELQYNSAGAFGASSLLTFSSGKLLVGGTMTPTHSLNTYENDVNGATGLKIFNDAAASSVGSTFRNATLGVYGSTGFGVSGWASAFVQESFVNGGSYIGAYNGPINLATGISGRTIRQSISNTGVVNFLNNVYIGSISTAPTAYLQLAAGTAAAGTAPVKYTSGTLLTTIEAATKEYNNAHYASSNALNRYAEGGYIADFYTESNNVSTTETDLYTYTTKANTFAADGEKMIAEFSGITTGSATATRTWQIYFAGASISTSGTFFTGISATGLDWKIRIIGIRRSSSSIVWTIEYSIGSTGVTAVSDVSIQTGLTLSGTNVFKITGQAGATGAGSDQIKAEMGTISWHGAANN